MDSTILKLCKHPNRAGLVEYLNEQSLESISNLVHDKLRGNIPNNDVDPLLLVRAIILGSPADGENSCLQRRVVLLQVVIDWLGANNESGSSPSTRLPADVVNILLPEIEILSDTMLHDAAIQIMKLVQDNQPVQARLSEILAKIWNVLSTTESVEKTNDIIERITSSKWHPQASVGLASALNEMELTPPQLLLVIKRMLRQLEHLEIEETPPFIYQLLLLSRKGQKSLVLSGICNHFNQRLATGGRALAEAEQAPNLRMEGTVMLHIAFAIKQDQDLGNELVKFMKNDKDNLLEAFSMACLLSAARIHRLEEKIFDLIKGSVISIYKDTEKLKKCSWIAEYTNMDGGRARHVLLDIAQKSALGWDQVIQSLTQLAMILIDSANQGSWLKSQNTSAPKRTNRSKQGPLDQVVSLGVEILLNLFKLHDVVRTEILEQITSRIVSRSGSATDFLQLLKHIILECPHAIEMHLGPIKDTLDYISLLPHSIAEKLLKAVLPIVNIDSQFRDRLMLVLRKSMFAKEIDGRLVSVHGFLDLLQCQLAEAQHRRERNSSKSTVAEGVAFEILGLLRKCFSQQCEIRIAAYNGLGALAHKHTLLTGDVFEMLYAQFQKVYETDTSISTPLKLEACMDNVSSGGYSHVAEPVHVLLSNLSGAARKTTTNKTNNPVVMSAITNYQEAVSSLMFRLSKSDLEDYELDKTAQFDMATITGLRNNLCAGLLLGSYEAMMEHEFISRGDTMESLQTVLKLFQKRKTLVTLLKENSTNEKGRKIPVSQYGSTVLSFECAMRMIQTMFLQGDTQSPARSLRSDIDFIHFIVSSAQSSLPVVIDNAYNDEMNQHFDNCAKIAQVYMHILRTEDSDSSFINHQPKKGNSVLGAIIDGLRSIFDIVVNVWEDRFVQFMAKLLGTAETPDQREMRNKVISHLFVQFKDILAKYLSDQSPLFKEAASVMQIVIFLASQLDREADDFVEHTQKMVEWLEGFARERPIEDVALVKEIMVLLVQLCGEIRQFDTITYLAQDVHTLHGDLEVPFDSQGSEKEPQYVIIHGKTLETITLQLLAFLHQAFDDLVWCIGRLKQSAVSFARADDTSRFEKETCQRLLSYLMITSELTKAVLAGLPAENLIKTLEKAYKTMLTLVKYYLSREKDHDIPSEFIQVIEMAGNNVTDKMYKFLTIHGQRQDETGTSGRSKYGKKNEANTKERAKIVRESRMIPNLIFAVEQFEQHLIQLSRKSKKDLMQYMKRSTARDFKIKLDSIKDNEEEEEVNKLKRALTDVGDNDGDEEEEASTSNNGAGPGPVSASGSNASGRKRARRA